MRRMNYDLFSRVLFPPISTPRAFRSTMRIRNVRKSRNCARRSRDDGDLALLKNVRLRNTSKYTRRVATRRVRRV